MSGMISCFDEMASRLNQRTVSAFLITSAIFVFLYVTNTASSSFYLGYHSSHIPKEVDLRILESYGLSPTIDYARYEMVVVPSTSETALSDHLDVPLPTFHNVDLQRENFTFRSPGEDESAIIVQSPRAPPRPGTSSMVFGVATTFDRLNQSLSTFAHWASPINARVYAIVDSVGAGNGTDLKQAAARLGFQLEVWASSATWDDRYFSLVELLYRRRGSAKWAAIIDDDTMFLSISNVLEQLGHHDASRPQYVGGISEDLGQIWLWGLMAYGGAGVFISMPLLRQMNEVYDECFDALDITGERRLAGDRRVAHCIYKHTDAKLSVEYGLHQVDLHGDPSGLYESGRPQPLSIHHWKSWSEIDVEKLLVVSRVCGDACLLHRWRFSNGWYLNNGFSLVKYSQDLPWGDRTIEKTWEDWETASDYSYVHSLAPLRPRDEGKITYRLKDAIVVGNKAVRQIYVHHPPDGGDDRVIDILWRAG